MTVNLLVIAFDTVVVLFFSGYSVPTTGIPAVTKIPWCLHICFPNYAVSLILIRKRQCCHKAYLWPMDKTLPPPGGTELLLGMLHSLVYLYSHRSCVFSLMQQRPSMEGIPRYMDSWHVMKETAR